MLLRFRDFETDEFLHNSTSRFWKSMLPVPHGIPFCRIIRFHCTVPEKSIFKVLHISRLQTLSIASSREFRIREIEFSISLNCMLCKFQIVRNLIPRRSNNLWYQKLSMLRSYASRCQDVKCRRVHWASVAGSRSRSTADSNDWSSPDASVFQSRLLKFGSLTS